MTIRELMFRFQGFSKGNAKRSVKWGLIFAGAGFLFPTVAWVFKNEGNLLFLIICMAPLVMGGIAAWAGHWLDRLSSLRLAQTDEYQELVALRKVVEASRLGSWKWDYRAGEVSCDQRWYEIFGLEFVEGNSFQAWRERVHPSDLAEVESQYSVLFSGTRDRIEVVNRLLRKDGTWIWTLNQTWVAERDETGKPIHLFGTVVDVSEHIKREQLSAEIQKLANIGGWELDLQTQKTRWTDQTYVIHGVPTGTPTDKIMGISFYAPHERDRLTECIKLAISGHPMKERFEFIDAHQCHKWVEVTAQVERNAQGEPVMLRGTFQDATQVQRLNLELKNHHQQLEEAQEVAKVGNWSFDRLTGKIEWSKQMFAMFPFSRDQLMGNAPSYDEFRSMVHPDDLDQWDATLQKCFRDGKPYRMRFRTVFSNRMLWIEARGQGVMNHTGQVVALRGTCQDISQSIEQEREIEQQRLKSIHTAKLASLGEMSAGVAHEINNPLAIISGTASLLHRFKDDPEKFQTKVETLNKAVQRISKIVNGLRKFARSSAGMEFATHRLTEVVQECLIMAESKSKRLQTPITVELEAEGLVDCDPLEIEQVVINLVSNAIDAVQGLSQKWVKIRLFEQGEAVVLQVMDSGGGIPVEVEEKMFQPFFTTKPVGEGTGLGLSICKGILDHHRASIVVNREFEFTCFEIRFPRARTNQSVA